MATAASLVPPQPVGRLVFIETGLSTFPSGVLSFNSAALENQQRVLWPGWGDLSRGDFGTHLDLDLMFEDHFGPGFDFGTDFRPGFDFGADLGFFEA